MARSKGPQQTVVIIIFWKRKGSVRLGSFVNEWMSAVNEFSFSSIHSFLLAPGAPAEQKTQKAAAINNYKCYGTLLFK